MIKIFNNILTESELYNIQNICDNLQYDESPGNNNYYYRKYIDISDNIKNTIFQIIKDELKIDYLLIDSWINIVSKDSNKNDEFHTDINDLTFVFYLNDEYDGGNFEYIEEITNEKKQIKPAKNQLIIMNNKLKHRVLNVIEGRRYSLVVFLKYKPKDKKSLL